MGKGPRDYEVRHAEGSAPACSSLQAQPTIRKIGTVPHLQAGPPTTRVAPALLLGTLSLRQSHSLGSVWTAIPIPT